ncbi:MAG: hypothetical protein JXA37_11550 [Chloroflexia bacterium]|nr:hypothetical protein [Chloroflexia bacterium]
MITALDLLEHLESKLEAALNAEDDVLASRLEQVSQFVREIAQAALVAGDTITLQEARRLAARLGPFGFAAALAPSGPRGQKEPLGRRTCPRCGQEFSGPAGPFEQLGSLLCSSCTREILADIHL